MEEYMEEEVNREKGGVSGSSTVGGYHGILGEYEGNEMKDEFVIEGYLGTMVVP